MFNWSEVHSEKKYYYILVLVSWSSNGVGEFLWQLSAQALTWLEFQLEGDRQFFLNTSEQEKVDDHGNSS